MRGGPRSTEGRSPGSIWGVGYSASASSADGAWALRALARAFFMWPQPVVSASRLCDNTAKDCDLAGSLRYGDGFAYEYAARGRAPAQMLVQTACFLV